MLTDLETAQLREPVVMAYNKFYLEHGRPPSRINLSPEMFVKWAESLTPVMRINPNDCTESIERLNFKGASMFPVEGQAEPFVVVE